MLSTWAFKNNFYSNHNTQDVTMGYGDHWTKIIREMAIHMMDTAALYVFISSHPFLLLFLWSVNSIYCWTPVIGFGMAIFIMIL